ncbi:MAG: hypothetical protein JM58_02945 [Peptococcaceae bacterium BICA1-8]|nr:MAG: hypothetical protein JM58_02945 [Peptococcaceae bacterium BICA1-8]
MDLILRIKEFYILEALQVKLYQSQLESLEDNTVRHAYERMVELEQHHIDYHESLLIKYGEKPPVITGGLSGLVGMLWGEGLDLLNENNRYLTGIKVEQKAMEMHQAFILEAWKYPDICKRLWHNMTDEEFHMLWFKDKLEKLPHN